MISIIKGISLKRIIEIFLSYDLLSFYKQPLQNLDDGIPEKFTKCEALEKNNHLPEGSKNIFDFINEKYGLEGEPERREVFSLIAPLELAREGLQNFFRRAERSKLSMEVKGEIFSTYLRLCIKDICLFLHDLNSKK